MNFKANMRFKKNTVDTICMLYLFLFVYAAMNKGLDFEKFQVELGQSPLLSAFAAWISWIVLIVEFTIVFFLLIPKTKIKALYAGFCLMSMFTAYIFIMLNYSSFLPCSCGGILEKMSWKQHLLFNVFFVAMGGIALWLHHKQTYVKSNKWGLSYSVQLFVSTVGGTVIVVVLFLLSEEMMHHKNPFIRRYPHHPVTLKHTIDLKYNSYYFAGSGDGKIYLGNTTVPLFLLSIDSKLKQQKIRATFDRKSFAFQTLKIAVRPPYFYILDGRSPVIFSGQISDWKASLQKHRPPYFNVAVPIDSCRIVFRGNRKINKNNVLGIFNSSNAKTQLAPQLLQKQIDGIFDTDGMLHYSAEMKKIIYIYNYRNQYIVAEENGKLDYRSNTIDTISHAQIKVAYLKNKTERTMAVPALTVNGYSSVYSHLLFVNSNVPGRYEHERVWEEASVIDVYDLNKKAYLFSFHVYENENKKLRSFMVTASHLYALIDTKLVIYELNEKLKNEIKGVSEIKF
ncbi:MAG TPA: MauE/DoxX family redox-associated membrane protein [Flavobacterium sp.]|uniref:MauE/DoxX family redox-associated membrane protein n=1 Tax=Flavobacterium TaxID=237 RepID=UPI002ED1CEA8